MQGASGMKGGQYGSCRVGWRRDEGTEECSELRLERQAGLRINGVLFFLPIPIPQKLFQMVSLLGHMLHIYSFFRIVNLPTHLNQLFLPAPWKSYSFFNVKCSAFLHCEEQELEEPQPIRSEERHSLGNTEQVSLNGIKDAFLGRHIRIWQTLAFLSDL